jgi:hypothetical protein
MTTYLVKCECGKDVSVQVGQAGEQVSCACGKQVSVPPLRMLRHLPVAEQEVNQPGAAWDARKGAAAAGFIAAFVLVAIAAWSWFSEPVVPTFPADHESKMSEFVDTVKPLEAWQMWIDSYRPLAVSGFTQFRHPHAEAIEEYIADKRFLQKVLLVLAAVAAAIAAAVAFWPEQTRRQGDKETRRR